MPPKLELLFHPKKKAKSQGQRPPSNTPPLNTKAQLPQDKTTKKDEEEDLQLPDTPFQEFRLLSSALNGWKYDVMRFDSRKPVDIYRWHQPVKLNRKDLRWNDETAVSATPQAVGPMLGPDGKPVIGPDGKMVMVDAEGRPIQVTNGSAPEDVQNKDKGKFPLKKRFQKKTRQVFPVAEEIRQLRKEERYPWVIEDSSPGQNELWTAQMEDLGRAGTHAFFMPAANEVFKFVPSHRWYKFQKKLKHDFPTDLANVEALYNKKRDPQQWLATRKGKAPSAATAAMFKAEAEGKDVVIGSSLVVNSGQSLGPGGRKLKTVDSGMDHLFNEDDNEGGVRRRKERELGEEGDMDEQIYEEDFADDDEHAEADDNDEEAKEAEERLKKEYRAANKERDVSDDEGDDPTMSKQAKAIQKLIRNHEGNNAYGSDDEKNPYASSEEEEEEPVVLPTAASAIQEQQQKIESRTETPKLNPQPRVSAPAAVKITGSRPTSPGLSPSHSGHSVIAKRATSPHIPKPRAPNAPNGGNMFMVHANAVQSRSTSPTIIDGVNGDATKVSLKRKADTSTSANMPPAADSQPPKSKKRKATVQGSTVSSAELESMLVEWLKTTTDSTTRDCIQNFTPYLVDAEKKAEFSAMVRKHATLKNGVLVPKSSSSPPSPPA